MLLSEILELITTTGVSLPLDITAMTALTDTEWLKCVLDLLLLPDVQRMQNFVHHRNVNCLVHCIHVSYACYNCFKRDSTRRYTAARVGLLHDLFLYQRKLLPTRRQRVLHLFTHGKKAMENACALVELSKKEQRAIARHMFPLTPIPSISREGLALSYYDKVCGLKEMMGQMR